MPFLAPRLIAHPNAAWALATATGALVVAPLGVCYSLTAAILSWSAYGFARPRRAASPAEAARRAALTYAALLMGVGAVFLVAGTVHRGPTVVAMLLGAYACDLPFYGFIAYVVGAVLVGPFARAGQDLEHGTTFDTWHRAVTTGAAVLTVALLPSVLSSAQTPALGFVTVIGFGASWLACLWVITSHTRARRLLDRIRNGDLDGYRIRETRPEERLESLARMFSGFDADQPMETLVQLEEGGAGAYRTAPIEEPIALVPAASAQPSATSPAMIAALIPMIQALLLLLVWSAQG